MTDQAGYIPPPPPSPPEAVAVPVPSAPAVPAGWHDDGSGRMRWWDGTAWTEHVTPLPGAVQVHTGPVISDAARQERLMASVAEWTRAGWRTDGVTANQAIMSKVRRMGWFWNTVGVIFTAGLWLIYVIYRALNRKVDRAILHVDEYGTVTQR